MPRSWPVPWVFRKELNDGWKEEFQYGRKHKLFEQPGGSGQDVVVGPDFF